MSLFHMHVPAAKRAEVARALIDAAGENHVHDVRTSGEGFYAPRAVWEKASEVLDQLFGGHADQADGDADQSDPGDATPTAAPQTPPASAEDATTAGQDAEQADAAGQDATTSQAPAVKTTSKAKAS